jgi:hypothetical protein
LYVIFSRKKIYEFDKIGLISQKSILYVFHLVVSKI